MASHRHGICHKCMDIIHIIFDLLGVEMLPGTNTVFWSETGTHGGKDLDGSKIGFTKGGGGNNFLQ